MSCLESVQMTYCCACACRIKIVSHVSRAEGIRLADNGIVAYHSARHWICHRGVVVGTAAARRLEAVAPFTELECSRCTTFSCRGFRVAAVKVR